MHPRYHNPPELEIPRNLNNYITGYQVLTRLSATLGADLHGEKVYFSYHPLEDGQQTGAVKARLITLGKAHFLLGNKNNRLSSRLHGHFFLRQGPWHTWRHNPEYVGTHNDSKGEFPLIRGWLLPEPWMHAADIKNSIYVLNQAEELMLRYSTSAVQAMNREIIPFLPRFQPRTGVISPLIDSGEIKLYEPSIKDKLVQSVKVILEESAKHINE